MSAITIYGISNCDTVKKARRWLEQQRLDYRFHDFRKDGLTPTQVKALLNGLAWEELLNRRGRTWRELSDSEKQVSSASQATRLFCKYPTLIKRPVLVSGKQILVGFDPDRYTDLLAK
jgi:Spx/MgsR family transcriptional regulator